ncbi:MAG: hypothetical protein CM15mP49_04900 [Actinomycetota bacterium]|nr:MAG: hypothetical protein CM15mP49_04900 [Actinomycetota bacterium]
MHKTRIANTSTKRFKLHYQPNVAASRTNSPGLGMYAASKSAIETLTRQWSLELAPIRVNAVGPGMVITEGTAQTMKARP